MDTDNDETRNWTQLAAENKELKADVDGLLRRLEEARITIADYQRAMKVAGQVGKGNDVLRSVETRTYQTQGVEVEVDDGFGDYMFTRGFQYAKECAHAIKGLDQAITRAIEEWKAR
jgi:hypothetical protein